MEVGGEGGADWGWNEGHCGGDVDDERVGAGWGGAGSDGLRFGSYLRGGREKPRKGGSEKGGLVRESRMFIELGCAKMVASGEWVDL